MRDKEIRLSDMPSRVICERQEDGSVSCRVFEGGDVVDLQVSDKNPLRKQKSFFEPETNDAGLE